MTSLSSELKSLISIGLMKTPLPIKKGNSIIVGHIVIRYNKNTGYHIFDTKSSSKICSTNSKAAALCVAKKISKNQSIDHVLYFDKQLEKYLNDLEFYTYTMSTSSNMVKRDIASMRAETAEAKAESIQYRLEKIIFEE